MKKLSFIALALIAACDDYSYEQPDNPCADGILHDPGCACDENPGGGAIELPALYHNQNTEQWCWAAVSSELTDYYRGVHGIDCQFLNAYFAANGFAVDCCGNPAACYRGAQSLEEIQLALYQVGGLYARVNNSGPLPEPALLQELANGRPVVVGLVSSFAGHVILVVGTDGQGHYTVHDPYYGPGILTYNELLQSPITGARWGGTIYEITDDASRCEEFCG